METLFIYIAKSSGLIGMFYISYYLLLRKETFFIANRWFLLAGLFTSVILPWIVFTTIVWVEPEPAIDWSKVPVSPAPVESFEINWYLILTVAYTIGTATLFIKFLLDFWHLNRVLKGKIAQQQADHKFIDVDDNVAPFSYFNTIVYNSSMYSDSEMEIILEHEKVHSEQFHTIDVLISRFFCILFWFNPFMWLYKNAILQNLEFIADNVATKNLSDKKAYQLTLLKITTHENCVALTNHFYQSLIKKRIVMLNKNQSKKWNTWKYASVIPLLAAFVLLFQTEVIAKEKYQSPKVKEQSTSNDEDVYKITKNTSETELREKAAILSEKYGIKTTYSKVKRNTNNELIGLKIKLQKGKETPTVMEVNNGAPIKDFAIAISKNNNGTTNIGIVIEKNKTNDKLVQEDKITTPKSTIPDDAQIYINGAKSDKAEIDKLDPAEIASMNVIKNESKKEIRIITKKFEKIGSENDIYINGKKISQNDLNNLDQNNIASMDVNKGEKTIHIVTKNEIPDFQDKNLPAPPTPPLAPKKLKNEDNPPLQKAPKMPKGNPHKSDKNLPVPPTPPLAPRPPMPPMSPMSPKPPMPPMPPKNVKTVPEPPMPKAPNGDPINGDKKAWNEYEKQMKDYEMQMKKVETQMVEAQMKPYNKEMRAYEKKMQAYNKEMQSYDKQLQAHDKEMQAYDKKMQAYDKEMQKKLSDLNNN